MGWREDYEESLYVPAGTLITSTLEIRMQFFRALMRDDSVCDESRSDAYSLAVRLAASG